MLKRLFFCLVMFGFVACGVMGAATDAPNNTDGEIVGVLKGMPDPAIIQADDGSYYIFATGKGLPFYRSVDLVNWKLTGRVFDRAVPRWSKLAIPETEGIWAPDIVKLNDKFYVYYCVSSFGSQRSVIGVVCNKTLDPASADYEWEDQGLVLESFASSEYDFNAIDPAAIQTADGKAYVVWGSFWGGLKLAELDPETGKVLKGAKFKQVASRVSDGTNAIEGAYLVQKNGYFYLFVSFDACCFGAESTYKVMVGRSRKIDGPYVDMDGKKLLDSGGTLVLASHDNWRGTGHNSVLTTDEGQWIVHHTYDTNRLDEQRVEQVRPLYWGVDGWPVVGEPLSDENKMSVEKASVTAREMEGTWRVSRDYGNENQLHLIPGGKIAFHKNASWKVDGNMLVMSWKASDGNVWVDSCIIEPSKDSFVGRNQAGAVIRGKKIK